MDAGTIATIIGIVILIGLQIGSMFFGYGKLTQRLKSVEKVVFEDGLIEKVNKLQISVASVEAKQDLLLQRANPGSTEPESDKLG